MPCTYYTPQEELAIARAEKKEMREVIETEMERVNILTRLLCSACRKMEREGVRLTREQAKWYTEHKKRDRARRKAEREHRHNMT